LELLKNFLKRDLLIVHPATI